MIEKGVLTGEEIDGKVRELEASMAGPHERGTQAEEK